MFDWLTLDDLYELHAQLSIEFHAIHATMMDGLTPRISPRSDEWAVKAAKCAEIHETATATYAEIARRERERYADRGPNESATRNGTRYCRTCGFADCEGARTGDCPRWPARETASEATAATCKIAPQPHTPHGQCPGTAPEFPWERVRDLGENIVHDCGNAATCFCGVPGERDA